MKKRQRTLQGFTLIEVLVTIVIIVILAGITIVALNPGQNISDANDAKRKADVVTMLDAIWQYAAKNNGNFPTGITATSQAISSTAANICSALVPTYVSKLPSDPTTGSYTSCTTYSTGYTILVDSTGDRITVGATLSDSTAYTQSR